MPVVRLDKLLSGQGFGSRREIRDLIRGGAVTVGGLPARSADSKVDTGRDRVVCGGREVVYREHLYILLNKPQGVVSASRDPKERTVVDLVPESLRRPGLFPAGRLDKDSEGLLIITDDGAFAHRMLAPRSHVPKRYYVLLDRPADESDVGAFSGGIVLDGEPCLPAVLEPAGEGAYVVIREGRYHQVKRMFEARGNRVLRLKRVMIGSLGLPETLAPGECREMSESEIRLALEQTQQEENLQ